MFHAVEHASPCVVLSYSFDLFCLAATLVADLPYLKVFRVFPFCGEASDEAAWIVNIDPVGALWHRAESE